MVIWCGLKRGLDKESAGYLYRNKVP